MPEAEAGVSGKDMLTKGKRSRKDSCMCEGNTLKKKKKKRLARGGSLKKRGARKSRGRGGPRTPKNRSTEKEKKRRGW